MYILAGRRPHPYAIKAADFKRAEMELALVFPYPPPSLVIYTSHKIMIGESPAAILAPLSSPYSFSSPTLRPNLNSERTELAKSTPLIGVVPPGPIPLIDLFPFLIFFLFLRSRDLYRVEFNQCQDSIALTGHFDRTELQPFLASSSQWPEKTNRICQRFRY